jgi:uncharacterized protein
MAPCAPECRVLVFAKTPQPGKAKTRLIPAIGAAGAAALHARLVRHTLSTACAAAVGPVRLWCSPSTRHPFFAQCAADFDVGLHPQEGDNLGARMAHALSQSLAQGPAILIGSDCPTLTPAHLRIAAAALPENDAVLVPAEDGGYVLIGLSRFDASLFQGIPWSTADVAAKTRARFASLGWRWRELCPLADVDRPEDLASLGRDYPQLLDGVPTIPPRAGAL